MRYMIVACCTGGCPAAGVRHRIPVRLVALDVLDVPNLRCARCGAAPREIHDVDAVEEEVMAKITVHGGPSDAVNDPPPPPAELEQPAKVEQAPAEVEPAEVESAAKPAKKTVRGRGSARLDLNAGKSDGG